MNQKIRYIIAFMLLAGILLLAGNRVAGAGVSPDQNEELLQKQSLVDNSVQAARPGTVRPPPGEVIITQSGSYSIGGFCNYTVEFIATDISVHVSLERPLPRPLPDEVHAVRQGCRVTYYQRPTGTRIDEFTAEMGTSKICFFAIPDENAKVYFFNVYSPEPVWGPAAETQVEDRVVCSDAGKSGVYVGTFEKQ
jgi:hypothetical protein